MALALSATARLSKSITATCRTGTTDCSMIWPVACCAAQLPAKRNPKRNKEKIRRTRDMAVYAPREKRLDEIRIGQQERNISMGEYRCGAECALAEQVGKNCSLVVSF